MPLKFSVLETHYLRGKQKFHIQFPPKTIPFSPTNRHTGFMKEENTFLPSNTHLSWSFHKTRFLLNQCSKF